MNDKSNLEPNSVHLSNSKTNFCANLAKNLKVFFALPKWLKIFLCALSVVAVSGVIASFALMSWAKDKAQYGEFVLSGVDKAVQARLDSGFAYDGRLYFERLDVLLRSKVIAYIDITEISWVLPIDKNAVSEIKSQNRHIKFITSQNLSEFNGQKLGVVEYKMDFSPLVKTIVRYYVLFVFLAMLLMIANLKEVSFGKFDYMFSIILTLFVAFLCIWQMHDGHHWGGDFSQYIAEGISIATGTMQEQVANNTIMMDKTDGQYGPYATPWGFSLLLAPIYAIFGFNLIAFKMVGIICYAAFVGIFYLFCARRLPRIHALFASLLFALNPSLIESASNDIISDIPFLCFALIAIVALGILFDDKTPYKSVFAPYILAILGGASMAYASAIRTNGLVIFCALLCLHFVFLLRHFAPNVFNRFALLQLFPNSPYRMSVHILVYFAFIVVYGAILLLLPSGKSNVHLQVVMGANLDSILHHLDYYILMISKFLTKKFGGGLALVILCVPLLCLGIKQSIMQNKQNTFYVLCLLGSFALIVLWPPTQELRYAFILLPFLVFYVAKGLTFLNEKKIQIVYFVLFGILIAAFANTTIMKGLSLTPKTSTYGAYTKEAKEAWDFIKNNTPRDSIILCFKPRVLYLNTNRLSFASSNVERLDEVDFVLITKDDYNMPNVNSAKFRTKAVTIFKNKDFQLYQVKN